MTMSADDHAIVMSWQWTQCHGAIITLSGMARHICICIASAIRFNDKSCGGAATQMSRVRYRHRRRCAGAESLICAAAAD